MAITKEIRIVEAQLSASQCTVVRRSVAFEDGRAFAEGNADVVLTPDMTVEAMAAAIGSPKWARVVAKAFQELK